jgi:hypothetical protein
VAPERVGVIARVGRGAWCADRLPLPFLCELPNTLHIYAVLTTVTSHESRKTQDGCCTGAEHSQKGCEPVECHTNEFLCVINQATRPGTPGKVYANVGMRTNEDARFSKMATISMVVFPGPSEMTARMSEPGKAPCCTVELRLHGLMTDGSPDSSHDFLNSHHH